MTSWNISRHPEWDQLLLAGITVREIAELCHRGPATIHYHLRRREHYEPGFRAKTRSGSGHTQQQQALQHMAASG